MSKPNGVSASSQVAAASGTCLAIRQEVAKRRMLTTTPFGRPVEPEV